jgi:hypothetical protein
MPACKTLKAYARQCGKNAKTGVSPDIYLVAYDDLAKVDGTTEVYTESETGLVDEIGIASAPATPVKFVKYGTVLNQGSIKETFTANDNGSFNIVKEVAFAINNIGSLDGRRATEDLIGLPVVGLFKLNSGTWVAIGLNGQFQLKGSEGTVDGSGNGRVLTLSGEDSVLLQAVDPTIIAGLLA